MGLTKQSSMQSPKEELAIQLTMKMLKRLLNGHVESQDIMNGQHHLIVLLDMDIGALNVERETCQKIESD